MIKNAPYRYAYIDIVGGCNAKCDYCSTGSRNRSGNGRAITQMSPETYKELLIRLLDHGVLSTDSLINLYNWGEPFLNKRINEIIGYTNERGLKYAISTNASIVPSIDDNFAKGLEYIGFSVSGFSKDTYGRMHGFDFSKITQNISRIVKQLQNSSYKPTIELLYHVYKYNYHELKTAERWADSQGIIFKPFNATIANYNELVSFVNNQLPPERYNKIHNDLYCVDELSSKMKMAPKDYLCRQFDVLTIDESANLLTCCALPFDHRDYSIGNLLTGSITDLLERKTKMPVCKTCISTGLAYSTRKLTVPMYNQSVYQRYRTLIKRANKLNSARITKKLSSIIRRVLLTIA